MIVFLCVTIFEYRPVTVQNSLHRIDPLVCATNSLILPSKPNNPLQPQHKYKEHERTSNNPRPRSFRDIDPQSLQVRCTLHRGHQEGLVGVYVDDRFAVEREVAVDWVTSEGGLADWAG